MAISGELPPGGDYLKESEFTVADSAAEKLNKSTLESLLPYHIRVDEKLGKTEIRIDNVFTNVTNILGGKRANYVGAPGSKLKAEDFLEKIGKAVKEDPSDTNLKKIYTIALVKWGTDTQMKSDNAKYKEYQEACIALFPDKKTLGSIAQGVGKRESQELYKAMMDHGIDPKTGKIANLNQLAEQLGIKPGSEEMKVLNAHVQILNKNPTSQNWAELFKLKH